MSNISTDKSSLPKVSFVIPTLNAGNYLRGCLESIMSQDYPVDKMEVIIADGGSADSTLSIARKFNTKICENPLKTAESGKAVGIDNSTGKYICLVDSDNLLTEDSWLRRMVFPLEEDDSLIGSEPLYYEYRKEDGFIDRYCALMGMNDPLVFWLGSYDRMNLLSGTWTGLDVCQKEFDHYIEVSLESGNIPTIGANGCMFRTSVLKSATGLYGDYFFDMDILEILTEKRGPQKFAKVRTGIVHLFCGSDMKRFKRKQSRRVRDFLYRRSVSDVLANKNFEERKYTYGKNSSSALIRPLLIFIFQTVTVIPLLYQALKGYKKKPDLAWFAHPILCWITLISYTVGMVQSLFVKSEFSRENWK